MFHQLQRRFAQQAQTTGTGQGFDLFDRLALDDHLAQFVVEVQQLARAIAAMVEALRSSQSGLEERVAARTAELQASEAHSRAILETALDSIITIDEAGCVTEFNPAAERTFGFRRAEVLGKPLAELLIPPEQRAAHKHELAERLPEVRDGKHQATCMSGVC